MNKVFYTINKASQCRLMQVFAFLSTTNAQVVIFLVNPILKQL